MMASTTTTTTSELVGTRPAMAQPSKDDQNRRSACDRCRKQKLRCERRSTATLMDACNRCLKSRSKCVTGPSLPMGRPRIRTRSMSPFDYRSIKRGHYSPVAELFQGGMPPLTKSHTSPTIHDPAVTTMTDIPITSVSAVSMLPPTTLAMLGMTPEPKLMHDGIFPEYNNLYHTGPPQVMRPPSTGQREDYIHSLYDLNAQLLGQCFQQSKNGGNSQWHLGNAHSIDSIVAGISHPVDHSPGSRLSLGELLESSNEFLRISQALMFSHSRKSPPTSRHNSIDYANPNYGASAYHQMRNTGGPNYSPVSPGYDDKEGNFSPSSMPSLSSSVATSMSPGIPERLDFPTLLTLYNSYTTLLRIYRTILTRVHLAILSQPMPWSALESIIPGVYPEGVQMEQRPDLHAKVFVQMCREMLDQMEKNITLSTKFYHGGAEPDFLRSLVDTLVKAEAAEGAARIVSPKSLVDEILHTIDSSLAA